MAENLPSDHGLPDPSANEVQVQGVQVQSPTNRTGEQAEPPGDWEGSGWAGYAARAVGGADRPAVSKAREFTIRA